MRLRIWAINIGYLCIPYYIDFLLTKQQRDVFKRICQNNKGRTKRRGVVAGDVTHHSEILDFQLTNFGITINNT